MRCKKGKDFFIDYKDLSEGKKGFLKEHFKICPECFKEFEEYNAALGLLQKALDFKPPANYWEGFSPKKNSAFPLFDFKSYLREKLDKLLALLRTPLLGPVPAYVFSVLILIGAAISLSSVFRSGGYSSGGLVNNLIIYEGQLLSAKDDGLLTIYTVSQK
ncbi:MAG: hypothetical protein Q8O10_09430 [candidate division Zixibacteria bacterium]|nr:hypothetical protein [candidate division Zixibacteria bacterium]